MLSNATEVSRRAIIFDIGEINRKYTIYTYVLIFFHLNVIHESMYLIFITKFLSDKEAEF